MNGVLIIDKPAGITSHDVVARVRRILGERRAGHTGTLDPFATGVLVVLLGQATRLAQFLSDATKEYEAVIRLGYATDTGDLTGARLSAQDQGPSGKATLAWTDEEIEAALNSLCGEIHQVPPMYSAKKHKGRRLYEMARRGEEVERPPVCVTIYRFEATQPATHRLKQNDDGTVDLAVRVVCSAGTYIRTLAEDTGRRLSIAAHLTDLRRTRVGDFAVKNAITLEQLKRNCDEGTVAAVLLAPDAALSTMPFVHLNEADARRVRNGMTIRVDMEKGVNWADGTKVKMRDGGGNLVAVGVFDTASNLLHPRVVLAAEN